MKAVKIPKILGENVRQTFMETPIILLFFANDANTAFLQNLKEESTKVYQALETVEDKKTIQIHREESATTDTINHQLNRHQNRIVLFHYAGHANGVKLQLEDQAGNARGLAQLLGQLPELQLVFLNGCSTKGQVERLLQAGVPAVIATSVPIGDKTATEFATHFYKKLANKGTIQGAFEFAAGAVAFKNTLVNPLIKPITVTRDISFNLEDIESLGFPWGLYYDEAKPAILQYTLPNQLGRSQIKRPQDTDYEVNEYLYSILEAMIIQIPSIEQELEAIEDEREESEMIANKFPNLIGFQIRSLFTQEHNRKNIARLRQLLSTYIAASQLVFYTVLSQLWKEKSEGRLKDIPLDLKHIFDLSDGNFNQFDFWKTTSQIMKTLAGKVEWFIPEFEKMLEDYETKGEFYDAYLYLASIRGLIVDKQTEQLEKEIDSICADTEYALSLFLSQLAFLIKYQMITVRHINISNPRHKSTVFNHFIHRLNYSGNLQSKLKTKSLDKFLDNNSIILLKDMEVADAYLNLTPFIIDRNAYIEKKGEDYTTQATDLYTFAFAKNAEKEVEYIYLKSRHNIFLALDKEVDRLSTGMVEVSKTNRASRIKKKSAIKKPYAPLKEQFDHLQAAWNKETNKQ